MASTDSTRLQKCIHDKYSTTPFFHLHRTSTSNVSSNRTARSCNHRMPQHTLKSDWEREEWSQCSFLWISSFLNDKAKHESPSASLSMQMHTVLCQNYSTAENFLFWRKRNLTKLWLFPSVWLKNPLPLFTVKVEQLQKVSQKQFRESLETISNIFDASLSVLWQEGREEAKCWISSASGAALLLSANSTVETVATLSCALSRLTNHNTPILQQLTPQLTNHSDLLSSSVSDLFAFQYLSISVIEGQNKKLFYSKSNINYITNDISGSPTVHLTAPVLLFCGVSTAPLCLCRSSWAAVLLCEWWHVQDIACLLLKVK